MPQKLLQKEQFKKLQKQQEIQSEIKQLIADKITSIGKAKQKETKESEEIYIPPNKAVAFKNNAPFINCISKIDGVKIDNTEDLDVVMSMYNLLEYSKNY